MPHAGDPLRPALELAFDVARAGASLRPARRVPPPLRRYLGFTKVSAPLLETVRRVVDDDHAFRRQVAAVAAEDDVGRAGFLWLHRPEGWQDELDALLAESVDAEPPAPRTDRRLERERAARGKAEESLRALRSEADEARRGRDEARAAHAAAERKLAEVVADRLRLAEDRDDAVRRLKAAEARAAEAAAERNDLRRRLRLAEEIAEATARASGASEATAPAARTEPPPMPSAGSQLDRAAVGRAVAAAAEAATALGEAMRNLSRAVLVDDEPGAVRAASAERGQVGPAAEAEEPRRRRTPVALPGGVRDDGPDAAEHLCRLRGAVLLVDGYNVSKSAWPDLPPAEQRARLVQALGTLTARTGIEVDVIFDGADVPAAAPLLSPRGVRVRYSEPEVEADDVILDLVQAYPTARPVVVASSDGRVRGGARAGGANLLHAAQLLSALQR